MDDPCSRYESQCVRARKTLDKLYQELEELNLKLKSDPINAHLHKDLRTMNLNIRITQNEIDLAEYSLNECKLKYNSSEN